MAKITAVNARGEKQVIPEHWLADPKLGKQFSLPPSARVEERAETKKQGELDDIKAPNRPKA